MYRRSFDRSIDREIRQGPCGEQAAFSPPSGLTHAKFVLIPMHPDIAALDHQATVDNRAHLLVREKIFRKDA